MDASKFLLSPENKKHPEFVIAVIAWVVPSKGHIPLSRLCTRSTGISQHKGLDCRGGAGEQNPYQEELEVLVKRLGLAHIVEFLGARRDIRRYSLRLIFWSCLPLLMRPLAEVVVEGLCAGVPVVATRIARVVDIVEDRVDGLLAAPGDPETLADAIIKVLKDRN